MESLKVLQIETWRSEFSEDECNFDEVKKYLDFVKEASERYDPSRYSEWHHVMPKCIDKDHKYDSEGVRINGADHFRAHLILSYCFVGKLRSITCYALMRMKHNVVSHGEEITPEDWEKAVSLYSKSNSERVSKRVGDLNPNYGKHYHLNLSKEQREIRSERMKGNKYGTMISKESRKRMSENFSGEGNPFYGKKHTDESKRKISENRTGPLNPCYSKIWITNGEVCKRVSEEDLENYIKLGYYKGRLVSEKARLNMSKSSLSRNRDSKGRWESNE